jgi:hypothetical protein
MSTRVRITRTRGEPSSYGLTGSLSWSLRSRVIPYGSYLLVTPLGQLVIRARKEVRAGYAVADEAKEPDGNQPTPHSVPGAGARGA